MKDQLEWTSLFEVIAVWCAQDQSKMIIFMFDGNIPLFLCVISLASNTLHITYMHENTDTENTCELNKPVRLHTTTVGNSDVD